jgi:hypothetical protein
VSTWFAAQEGDGEDEPEDEPEVPAPPAEVPTTGYVAGGGRTLAGGSAPSSAAASSSASAPPTSQRASARSGPRTIKDLQGDSGHGHSHDDESDDEDTDMFAGGEKSGLAVKGPGNSNPQDQINNILDRARRLVQEHDVISSARYKRGVRRLLKKEGRSMRRVYKQLRAIEKAHEKICRCEPVRRAPLARARMLSESSNRSSVVNRSVPSFVARFQSATHYLTT